MKFYSSVVISLLFSLFAFAVFAAGGQNQTQNPIFGDNCVETIPPGLEDTTCEEIPAPDQSGVRVLFCDTTTVVICTEEEEEAEEEGEEETP